MQNHISSSFDVWRCWLWSGVIVFVAVVVCATDVYINKNVLFVGRYTVHNSQRYCLSNGQCAHSIFDTSAHTHTQPASRHCHEFGEQTKKKELWLFVQKKKNQSATIAIPVSDSAATRNKSVNISNLENLNSSIRSFTRRMQFLNKYNFNYL